MSNSCKIYIESVHFLLLLFLRILSFLIFSLLNKLSVILSLENNTIRGNNNFLQDLLFFLPDLFLLYSFSLFSKVNA